jgi:hypothetical protein
MCLVAPVMAILMGPSRFPPCLEVHEPSDRNVTAEQSSASSLSLALNVIRRTQWLRREFKRAPKTGGVQANPK